MRFLFIVFVAVAACGQTPPCTLRTIAGPPSSFGGDNGPAVSADLGFFGGFRFDPAGNLFIADTGNNRIRKVAPSGIITTVAGTGVPGFSGDGGPAINARLYNPVQVSPDQQGNLYIADGDSRIRKVDANGIITTFAGDGTPNFSGDGGLATQASIQLPMDVLAGNNGEVFIADTSNFRVREVDAQGFISTVAGSGVDEPMYIYRSTPPRLLGGQATAYSLARPSSLALDTSGVLYIGDTALEMVFRVDASGLITDYAGNGLSGTSPLGQSATSGQLEPEAIAFDSSGNLIIASPGGSIGGLFAVSTTGAVSQVDVNTPSAIAVDGTAIYFQFANSIYVEGSDTLIAGRPNMGMTGDGGPAKSAQFSGPTAIAVDSQGDVYVVDDAESIRKIALDGTISHIAGNGDISETGDGGPAAQAGISPTFGISVDASGNLYLANGESIREVNTQGIISTVIATQAGIQPLTATLAPSGIFYYEPLQGGLFSITPTGTRGTQKLILPDYGSTFAWVLDASGDLYWLDGMNQLNRMAVDGIATSVPLPISGSLDQVSLAVDGSGNAYIALGGGNLYEVTSGGSVFTLARLDPALPPGDGPASQVDLGPVSYLTSDASGNLYFSDQFDLSVRELTAGCPAVVQPLIPETGVVNAGSYDPTYLAAGEIATIFGENLGPANGAGVPTADGAFPTQYAGVAVTVNGYPAPLLYVSGGQVNFVVPFEVEGQQARAVLLTYLGIASDQYLGPLGEADPGIFAIGNPDYTVNSASNPVQAGSYITIYGTGQGVSSVPQADGAIVSALVTPVLPVTAMIDDQPATVLYAGAAPGLVAGVLQINLQIPAQLAAGKHAVEITVGEWSDVQQSFIYTQ